MKFIKFEWKSVFVAVSVVLGLGLFGPVQKVHAGPNEDFLKNFEDVDLLFRNFKEYEIFATFLDPLLEDPVTNKKQIIQFFTNKKIPGCIILGTLEEMNQDKLVRLTGLDYPELRSALDDYWQHTQYTVREGMNLADSDYERIAQFLYNVSFENAPNTVKRKQLEILAKSKKLQSIDLDKQGLTADEIMAVYQENYENMPVLSWEDGLFTGLSDTI